MIQQISEAELDIMKIVWAGDSPILFASIMKELESRGRTWQKNTVITLLSRLMEKGFLKAKKIGRRNEYTPLVSEEEYQMVQTRNFVNRIFEGKVKGLVSNLIQSDDLTEEEYQELKMLLERRKK